VKNCAYGCFGLVNEQHVNALRFQTPQSPLTASHVVASPVVLALPPPHLAPIHDHLTIRYVGKTAGD
jgi:hypothetical protein